MKAVSQYFGGQGFDVMRLREDFPILGAEDAQGRRLAFLDSAASSQKPAAVIEAVGRYYRETNANIHRGVYDLSEQATAQYEAARHMVRFKIAKFEGIYNAYA